LGVLGVWFFGLETRGRTIEEIDRELAGAQPALATEQVVTL
jgi:hypothetical protein